VNRDTLKDAVEAAVTAVGFYSGDPNEQAFALAVGMIHCSGECPAHDGMDGAELRTRVGKAVLTLLQAVPERMCAGVLLDVSLTLAAYSGAAKIEAAPEGRPS
jgi:hypothetical protein